MWHFSKSRDWEIHHLFLRYILSVSIKRRIDSVCGTVDNVVSWTAFSSFASSPKGLLLLFWLLLSKNVQWATGTFSLEIGDVRLIRFDKCSRQVNSGHFEKVNVFYAWPAICSDLWSIKKLIRYHRNSLFGDVQVLKFKFKTFKVFNNQ